MPNDVINQIQLHDVSMDRVRPIILNDTGRVDFSILLPLPINFWPGSVGLDHEKAFPGTHLAAARQTWGTKWNAYGDIMIAEEGADTVLCFETAWAPPRGWIVALFNTLKCSITAKWLSEGETNGHIEIYDWSKIETGFGGWNRAEIEDGSDDHRHLHKLLWGVEEFGDEDEA